MKNEEGRSGAFDATRWSLVRQAQGNSPTSRQALSDLCEAYWKPVFRFLCYEGRKRDEAEELTQAFFAKLLETGSIAGANPSRGRFRSYVLGAVKHFLTDHRKAAQREKRGGGQIPESLDAEAFNLADEKTAPDDAVFDREWAFTVLDRALRALERRWAKQDKATDFELLKPWLTGTITSSQREATATKLGLSESAFKVTVHRLRKRFREHVREEIAQTVDAEADIGQELRYLLEVVSQ